MLSVFIYLLLVILDFSYFCKRKYSEFLIIYATIISNCWGLLKSDVGIYDWIGIITVLCCIAGRYRSNHFFNIKNDKVGSLILIMTGYVFLAAIVSPFRGVGSLSYCLMTARMELVMMMYFVFRIIPEASFSKAINVIFKLSTLTAVLYILQYFGLRVLVAGGNGDSGSDNYLRFANIPIFTIPIFAYYFVVPKLSYKSIKLGCWGLIILLSQTRGLIIGILSAIIINLKNKKNKINKSTIFTLIFIGILCSGLIMYRFSSQGSTGEGASTEGRVFIELVRSGEYKKLDSQDVIGNRGTLVFRLLMIYEKIEYLADRPFSLFFGAGSYHERSRQTQNLPFVFGSNSELGRAKVDTEDVMLISRFFRYGLCYILIFSLFLYRSYKTSKSEQNVPARIFNMIFWTYLIGGFGGNYYGSVAYMSIYLIFLSYSVNYSQYLTSR